MTGMDALNALLEQLDAHSDGVLIVDHGGRIRLASRAAEALLGLSTGASFQFELEEGTATEITLTPADQSAIVCEARVSAIEWEGRPARLITLQNITTRRRVEAALDHIADHMLDVVMRVSGGAVIEYASPSAKAVLGYAPARLVGRNALELVHPEDVERVTLAIEAGLQTGAGRVDFRCLHADGHYLWLESVGQLLRSENGEVAGIVFASREVTERKQAEEALHYRQAFFRALIENVSDIVTLVDAQGIIRYQSPSVERALGYPADELIGQNALGLIHPDDQAKARQIFQRRLDAADADQSLHIEVRARHQDGAWRLLDVTASNFISLGPFAGTVATMRDITERRRMELAEREQRALADSLRDTAAVLGSTLKLEEVLDRVLANVGRVVPHEASSVMLVEGEAARAVHYREAQGLTRPGRPRDRRFSITDTPTLRQMLATQQPVFIHDTQGLPDWPRTPEALWVRSHLAAPMRFQGVVIGFLSLDSATEGFFTPQHAERLLAFADQAAIAVENALLFERLSTEKRRIELLYELSQGLSASLDPHEVAGRALNLVTRTLGAFQGELLFVPPGTDDLVFGALTGYTAEQLQTLNHNLGLKINQGLAGWVAQTRKPAIVADARTDPHWLHVPGVDDHVRSVMSIPLVAGDELIGVLNIVSEQRDYFKPADLPVLMAVATPIALALQNARLFEERTHALAREQRLGEVVRTITSTLELSTILRNVVRLATELIDAEAGALSMVEGDTLVIQADATVNFPDHATHQVIPRDPAVIAWEVVESGQAMLLRDYPRNPRALPNIAAAGVKEIVVVPVAYGKRCLGVLALYHFSPDKHFTERDLALAESVGRQAGIAAQNARLFEDARQRAAELAALYRASAPLFHTTDVTRLAEQIVTAVAEEFEHAHCSVLLVDEDAQEVRPAAQHDRSATQFVSFPMRLYGPGLIPAAIRTGETIYVPDVERDSRYLRGAPTTRSELVLPLRAGDRVIGALNLESIHLDAFDERERRVLETLAERAGLALQNAQLFRAAERHAQHMSLLNAITRAAIETSDFTDMLQTLVERLSKVIDADSTTLTLWDSVQRRVVPGAASHSIREAYRASTPRADEPTITQAVIRSRRYVIVEDTANSPHVSPRLAALFPIRSCIGLPLVAGDQILGAAIIAFHRPHHFTPDEVQRAGQATDQVALAVTNGQLLRRLEQARKVAEEASRLKSEFLANTSHELRTPLNGILGALKLVLDDLCDTPEEERTFVRTAYEASRKLLRIIDDLLDIAKIEAGKMAVDLQAVDLALVFEEVYNLTRAQAEHKDLQLEVRAPPDDTPRVWANVESVRQILLNLVGNALKFTARGYIRVAAHADLELQQMRITVEDTGIGISPEAQDRLFEPFVQADGSTTRQYGGTGLGLSISKRLAELMNGTLALYSAGEDQGSTFTLTLPLAPHHE